LLGNVAPSSISIVNDILVSSDQYRSVASTAIGPLLTDSSVAQSLLITSTTSVTNSGLVSSANFAPSSISIVNNILVSSGAYGSVALTASFDYSSVDLGLGSFMDSGSQSPETSQANIFFGSTENGVVNGVSTPETPVFVEFVTSDYGTAYSSDINSQDSSVMDDSTVTDGTGALSTNFNDGVAGSSDYTFISEYSPIQNEEISPSSESAAPSLISEPAPDDCQYLNWWLPEVSCASVAQFEYGRIISLNLDGVVVHAINYTVLNALDSLVDLSMRGCQIVGSLCLYPRFKNVDVSNNQISDFECPQSAILSKRSLYALISL
jgi:hypothetical protein